MEYVHKTKNGDWHGRKQWKRQWWIRKLRWEIERTLMHYIFIDTITKKGQEKCVEDCKGFGDNVIHH